MKLIPLTQGKFSQVDDEDFKELNKYKWCAWISKDGHWYVLSHRWDSTKKRYFSFRMHRVIMNLTFKDNKEVDHKDGNGLNNQKENLRICNSSQNKWNSKKSIIKIYTSKYKGVCWANWAKKWRTQIHLFNKRIHVGYFDCEKEAALSYNKKATELFGSFSKLNEVL